MNKTEYMNRKGIMRRTIKEQRMQVFGDDLYLSYKDTVSALEKQILEYLVGEECLDQSTALITLGNMKECELLSYRETLMEIIGDGLPFLVTRYDKTMGVQLTLKGLTASKEWGYSGLSEFVFKGVYYRRVNVGTNIKPNGWVYEDTGDYFHSIGGIYGWEDMGSRIRIYMKHGDKITCLVSEPHKHPRDLLSRSVVVHRPKTVRTMGYAGTSTVSQGLHRSQPLRFSEAVKRTFTQVGQDEITWKRKDFLVEGIDYKLEVLSINSISMFMSQSNVYYYKASSLKSTDVCYFLHNTNLKGITLLTPSQPIFPALVNARTAPPWFDKVQQHATLINDYVKSNNKPHGISHA